MALYLYLFISLIGFSFSVAWRNFEYCEGTSWINFKENCYLFETKSHKRISFYDAEDYCRSQGAHLLSIHSEEENDFVLNTMSKGRFGDRHWIGLNVLAGDDKPQWSDDSPVDFQKRVPKDFFVNEKCFIIFLEKRGWRPEHCALHYAPICKRPADVTPTPVPPPTTVPPPQGNCPENWIQFDQKCYKYFGAKEEDRVQYKQARDACWALGKNHDLVSIHSIEEQAFLTQNLYKLGTSAWIGMRQVTSDEIGHDLVFGWIDNSRTDFKYWAAGHPPPGTWKYCARLSYETVAKGEWIADYCEISKYGYICQQPSDPNVPPPKPESSKCDAGSLSYRDSCYRYVLKPSTHEEAEKSCQNFGGHLASVVDGFEQAFLFNLLGSYSLSRDQFRFLWNGLKGVQGTRYLQWSDGQPLYYSNWKSKPVLSTKNDCVLMDLTDDLKWNVTDCSRTLPYICKTINKAPPKFPEVIGTCPGSESSWIDIGDEFCYHIAETPNHILSWDRASRYCTAKGMKMLQVSSDHQTKSLIAYLWKESREILLGLFKSFDKKAQRSEEPESFIWVDGTPVDYTNWDVRQPDTWLPDTDCAAFSPSTGKWKAIRCDEGGVTICQASKTVKK